MIFIEENFEVYQNEHHFDERRSWSRTEFSAMKSILIDVDKFDSSAVEVYDFKNDEITFNRTVADHLTGKFDWQSPMFVVDQNFCSLS